MRICLFILLICKFKINLSRLYYINYNDNLDYPFLSDDNTNKYKDELHEFDSDVSEKLDDSNKSDNSDELDESNESDESNDSLNDSINHQCYSDNDEFERKSANYYDKRNLKNKKIKKIKDKNNKNKRISKLINLKLLKKRKKENTNH